MAFPADKWDRHWETYQATARLNPAQEFRRRLVVSHIRRRDPAAAPLRVLDVGCGTGDFAQTLRAHFPSAAFLGIDKSRTGLELAGRKVRDAVFLARDLLEPQLPEERFRGWATVATCCELLEHVDAPERLLENVQPYLAPSADVIVTVPGGPMSRYDRHIGHRRHFRREELHDLLAAAGYEVRGVWGAGFPFFNLYRLVVIARGERLVTDVARTSEDLGLVSALAMRVFGMLFRLNPHFSARGWQLIALARYPGPRPRPAAPPADRPPAPGPAA